MSSLDALIADCRKALHDPPRLVVDAEKELMAMRDEMRTMKQALDASGRNEFDGLGEQMVRAAAEDIAREYHYEVDLVPVNWWRGHCLELTQPSWFERTKEGALAGIKNLVVTYVEQMLRNSETPPKARGDHG